MEISFDKMWRISTPESSLSKRAIFYFFNAKTSSYDFFYSFANFVLCSNVLTSEIEEEHEHTIGEINQEAAKEWFFENYLVQCTELLGNPLQTNKNIFK